VGKIHETSYVVTTKSTRLASIDFASPHAVTRLPWTEFSRGEHLLSC